MARFKRSIFFLFILVAFCSYGQVKEKGLSRYDSVRVVSFSINKLDTTIFIEKSNTNIDTSTAYFQIYDPAYKTYLLSENLGNIGLASNNILFQPKVKTGFSYGNNSYKPYKASAEEKNYYYSLLPYTDLYFSQGYKKEQVFHVAHLHNIRNKIYMGAKYRIINAPGRESFNQKAIDHALSVFTYYQTKDKRYGVFVDYLFTKIKNQENGGLVDDTVWLNYREGKSNVNPEFYLSDAESLVKESSVNLKQYYSLSKREVTIFNDTTKYGKRILLGRFMHSFDFIQNKAGFANNKINEGYFPMIPYDTLPVADSGKWYQVKNAIEYTNHELKPGDKESIFRYSVKLTHAYTDIQQDGYLYHFINLIPSIRLGYKPNEKLQVNVSGEYVTFNNYANDYTAAASVAYSFIRKEKHYGTISLETDFHNKEADWFYQHYHSTYFNWDNNFDKENIWHAGLNYSYPKLKVGLDYYNLYNYVFLYTSQQPYQYLNNNINVFNAYIFKDFVFWKFRIDNKIVYQYTDRPNLLRKPELIAMQSYVFSTHVFKKVMFAQIGVDLKYNTKYYANGYQVAYQDFYLQNTREVGNYLYADAYLKVKVKRFMVFLKLSNFLSGAIGYDHFTVPHYTMPDRVFAFGLSWIFHD